MSGLVLGESDENESGLAAGINDAFRQTGIAVGVAALGALLPAQSVLTGGSPERFVVGLHRALLVSAAIALVGAAVAAVTLRTRRPSSHASAADVLGDPTGPMPALEPSGA